MKIEKEHFLDAGEKGEDGFYEWYYEGYNYLVYFDNIVIVARSYDDEEYHLYVHGYVKENEFYRYEEPPYNQKEFITFFYHFNKTLGFKTFSFYLEGTGYKYIDISKIGKEDD